MQPRQLSGYPNVWCTHTPSPPKTHLWQRAPKSRAAVTSLRAGCCVSIPRVSRSADRECGKAGAAGAHPDQALLQRFSDPVFDCIATGGCVAGHQLAGVQGSWMLCFFQLESCSGQWGWGEQRDPMGTPRTGAFLGRLGPCPSSSVVFWGCMREGNQLLSVLLFPRGHCLCGSPATSHTPQDSGHLLCRSGAQLVLLDESRADPAPRV